MTKLLGYDQYLINIRTKHSCKSLTNQRVGKWNGCIKSWYSIASIYGAVISMNKLSIVRRKSYKSDVSEELRNDFCTSSRPVAVN